MIVNKRIFLFILLSPFLTESIISLHNKRRFGVCYNCRLYSDSFVNWYQKTSQGQFEGGNADWEETKLKSYSRSEVRLAEILENVCSDLFPVQDDCFAIYEEAEALIDKWWTGSNVQPSELFTWLCIDNLRYCCPRNHFGENCTACTLDETNNICSNHGFCDGEGTRKGNGSCICDIGYSGIHCTDCSTNFYFSHKGECKPCHKSCNDCFSYGSEECKECAVGWEMQDGSCEDIDECRSNSTCKSNQYCINNEGSFLCKYCDTSCKTCRGHGPRMCTACVNENNQLWSGKCFDEELSHIMLTRAERRLLLYFILFQILVYLLLKNYNLLALATIAILLLLVYKWETHADITVIHFAHYHFTNFFKLIGIIM